MLQLWPFYTTNPQFHLLDWDKSDHLKFESSSWHALYRIVEQVIALSKFIPLSYLNNLMYEKTLKSNSSEFSRVAIIG